MVTEVGQQSTLKLALTSKATAPASSPRETAVESEGMKLPPEGKTVPVGPREDESDPAHLRELVSNLNQRVQSVHRELKFSVDEDTGRTVIRVINSETEEVIRQIPPDEILAIARNFDGGEGLLLNTKV